MIALETEHGRFEAETLRKATALAKAAKKAAEAQAVIDAENRKLAYAKAGALAYRYMMMKYKGQKPGNPWICRPGDQHFRASMVDGDSHYWKVWLGDNAPSMELNGYRPVAILYGCDGNLRLLWTESCHTKERYCFSIGVHGDVWTCEPLPIEDFPPEWFETEE